MCYTLCNASSNKNRILPKMETFKRNLPKMESFELNLGNMKKTSSGQPTRLPRTIVVRGATQTNDKALGGGEIN